MTHDCLYRLEVNAAGIFFVCITCKKTWKTPHIDRIEYKDMMLLAKKKWNVLIQTVSSDQSRSDKK